MLTSSALDEAFERMASVGFELPNGFVNHGAMACEALAALGFESELGAWARRFSSIAGASVTPKVNRSFEWGAALGDYRQLPQWVGHFEARIAEEGWAAVAETWVPRLMPALATMLFHGAIRTAHAVRAVAATHTEPRRAELARALGYWAARYRRGAPAIPVEINDARANAVTSAARAARYYIAAPSIYFLHGVTGAMAVEILVGYLPSRACEEAIAQVRAEHSAMYDGAQAATAVHAAGALENDLAVAAETSGDPHEVKLVEACRRGWEATGDQAFVAAAETVTGRARPQ